MMHGNILQCKHCGQQFDDELEFLLHARIANMDDVRAGIAEGYVIVHDERKENERSNHNSR